MLKKGISVVLTVIMCVSLCIGVSAANTFTDVTEKNYSWAVNEIEEMASMGIIKGYSDKLFGPADDVTKIQALLLCSRILGYSEAENMLIVESASKAYEETLEAYDTDYKQEIAYLLYKGVLSTKELSVYIGSDNADVPLKRYEAATLMTKVMDSEEEAEKLGSSTAFTDSSDIPAAAKPYVNYVYGIGLMLGMNKTDKVNEFAPLVNVSRAQMSVLLYRMMNIMEQSYSFGTVESIDTTTNTIMFTDENGITTGISVLPSLNVKISVDGFSSTLDKIKPQSYMAVVRRNDSIYALEAVTVIADSKTEGVVNSTTVSSKGNSIKLRDVDGTEIVEYPVSNDVSVTYDGAPSTFAAIKTGYFAELEIKEGNVIVIKASAKGKTVVGTVDEIILSPEILLAVTTSTGDTENYTFAENATATRNGKESDVRSILVGDKVTLTLVYNQISKVTATSSNFTATGTIESILIATQPQITISSSGASITYSISRDAVFSSDGKDATIYDLRLGASITLTIQGETAVKITSTTPAVSSVLTGTIETVNTSYGFMILNVVNAQTGDITQTQVFLKKTGLKIFDSTSGKEIAQTALKQGMNVSVTGVMSTGAFEATTVIVLP